MVARSLLRTLCPVLPRPPRRPRRHTACTPPPPLPKTTSLPLEAALSRRRTPAASPGPRHPLHGGRHALLRARGRPSPSLPTESSSSSAVPATSDLEANKSKRDVWLAATDGSFARRLTSDPAADQAARFAPDGKSVLVLSSRGGSSQVWRIAVDGGEATQVTSCPSTWACRRFRTVMLTPRARRLPRRGPVDETAKRARLQDQRRAYDSY